MKGFLGRSVHAHLDLAAVAILFTATAAQSHVDSTLLRDTL